MEGKGYRTTDVECPHCGCQHQYYHAEFAGAHVWEGEVVYELACARCGSIFDFEEDEG